MLYFITKFLCCSIFSKRIACNLPFCCPTCVSFTMFFSLDNYHLTRFETVLPCKNQVAEAALGWISRKPSNMYIPNYLHVCYMEWTCNESVCQVSPHTYHQKLNQIAPWYPQNSSNPEKSRWQAERSPNLHQGCCTSSAWQAHDLDGLTNLFSALSSSLGSDWNPASCVDSFQLNHLH